MCTYISVSLPRIILIVRYSIAILLKIFVFATELYTSNGIRRSSFLLSRGINKSRLFVHFSL